MEQIQYRRDAEPGEVPGHIYKVLQGERPVSACAYEIPYVDLDDRQGHC
jgi:hypothetical protein